MTTLAIIGNGLAAKSLLFQLSLMKEILFEKVYVFSSEEFAPSCSLSTTSVASKRGTRAGISALGDLIVEGFEDFQNLVQHHHPAGVYASSQFNGKLNCDDQFLKRFNDPVKLKEVEGIKFKRDFFVVRENSYVINPDIYLEWLLEKAQQKLNIELIFDFVKEVQFSDKWNIRLNGNGVFHSDKIVFASGAYHRLWTPFFSIPLLKTIKPVPGSYLIFKNVNWNLENLSFTLEGKNLIFRTKEKELLIGTASGEGHLFFSKKEILKNIYDFFKENLDLDFPDFNLGEVKVGVREKASKRMPFVISEGNLFFIGGFYKNGFTISHLMAKKLTHQLLELDLNTRHSKSFS